MKAAFSREAAFNAFEKGTGEDDLASTGKAVSGHDCMEESARRTA